MSDMFPSLKHNSNIYLDTIPSSLSLGTNEGCDLWLELSADQSFVAGKLPTGKRGRAPNDGKSNPLQTEKKK